MSVRGKRASNYIPITHTFVPFVLRLLAILFIKHACIVMITVSGLKRECVRERNAAHISVHVVKDEVRLDVSCG